jgi:hypothetical protein
MTTGQIPFDTMFINAAKNIIPLIFKVHIVKFLFIPIVVFYNTRGF